MRQLLGAVALLLLLEGEALAFHVGKTFGDPPGAGGAGGIFYVAAPLERRWDCTMCHTEAPGRVRIRVDVSPPELFESFRYVVGQRYDFHVIMLWEGDELGRASGRSNFNAINVGATDDAGIFAGVLQGGLFYSGGDGLIAADTKSNGDTAWDFRWFAPEEPGTGTVTLYFGAVDGNGADSPPDITRTDPFGDDVFMARVFLTEDTGAATAIQGHPPVGWQITFPAPDRPASPTELHVAGAFFDVDAGFFPRSRAAGALAVLALLAICGRRKLFSRGMVT